MVVTTSDKTKTKAIEELLGMARAWEKEGKIQHAIEGYEAVVGADPQSKEAEQATDALMEIAKRYDQAGKKHSAYYLYHKMAEGRS